MTYEQWAARNAQQEYHPRASDVVEFEETVEEVILSSTPDAPAAVPLTMTNHRPAVAA